MSSLLINFLSEYLLAVGITSVLLFVLGVWLGLWLNKRRFSPVVDSLQQSLDQKQDQEAGQLKDIETLRKSQQELMVEKARIQARLDEKQAHFEQQKQQILSQQKEQQAALKEQFENLANDILEKKSKSFSASNQSSLEALLKPFKEQIDGFQKRVNEVHTESVKGQSSLEAELKKVLEVGLKMSDEANNLSLALKGDKKTTGNWGEAQLERTLQLAGLVEETHYSVQEKHEKDGQIFYPDFVIKLPDNKHLVLDSKVSLVDYDKAIAADTENEQQAALSAHVKAVKRHIDDLSKKNYSELIGVRSPSFVLMFMPIEPAYIEAMKTDKSLFNYGYGKNIILVSHTTLMPILRTVSNLWALEKNNESAREISQKAGDIYQNVVRIADNMQKMGKTINTLSNHYNNTVTGLVGKQGLYGKVGHFQSLSAKATESLPNVEMVTLENKEAELLKVTEIKSPEEASKT